MTKNKRRARYPPPTTPPQDPLLGPVYGDSTHGRSLTPVFTKVTMTYVCKFDLDSQVQVSYIII